GQLRRGAAAVEPGRKPQVGADLKGRSEASAGRWLRQGLDIAYGDPDAKTADGKPATRLTFGEKVRALELQGRALGFVKEGIELRTQAGIPKLKNWRGRITKHVEDGRES